MILLILGAGCATQRAPAKIHKDLIVEPRPEAVPLDVDGGFAFCEECAEVKQSRVMLKVSERDFLFTRLKIRELDDYVSYLLDLILEIEAI